MKYKQLHSICVVATLLLLLSLVGCDNNKGKEPTVYYADFVTCHLKSDNTIFFEQVLRNDQGSAMLYPTPTLKGNVYEGQRVMLQYYINDVLSEGNFDITATQVVSVRHDTIIDAHPDNIAAYPDDPVKMNASWRTGNYLNLDIQLEYYDKAHRLDLFYAPVQQSGDTIDVILRHDKNKDLPGYWTTAYASFYIPNLGNYQAMRIYANIPNEPVGYRIIDIKD